MSEALQNNRVQWMLVTHSFLFTAMFVAASITFPGGGYELYRAYIFLGFGAFGYVITFLGMASILMGLRAKRRLIDLYGDNCKYGPRDNTPVLEVMTIRGEELTTFFFWLTRPHAVALPLFAAWAIFPIYALARFLGYQWSVIPIPLIIVVALLIAGITFFLFDSDQVHVLKEDARK